MYKVRVLGFEIGIGCADSEKPFHSICKIVRGQVYQWTGGSWSKITRESITRSKVGENMR